MICEWLTKRIVANPAINYLPPRSFSSEANAAQEIGGFIAELNDAAKEFSSSASFSGQYLDLIHQAEAQAAQQHWAEAQEKLWEATFLVNRARESRGATRLRCWIVCCLMIWLIGLTVLGVLLREYGTKVDGVFGMAYWHYLFMGALGGITIALWGVVKHTKDLDFDEDFTFWYFLRPGLGAITGLVTVLMVKAGLFALQGASEERSIYPLYVLAFLAGFSERFFIQVADRVMTALLGGQTPSPVKAPSVPITPAKPSSGTNQQRSSPGTGTASKGPGA